MVESKPKEEVEEEVDFKIVSEDWSRYVLEDGSVLRVRINVFKIFRSKPQELGYPSIGISAKNLVSCMVPAHLKGKLPKGQVQPARDLDKELKFEVDKEQQQIYETFDGWRILVQPKLIKVFRFKKANDFEEPIYSVNIQQFVNIEKITKTESSG